MLLQVGRLGLLSFPAGYYIYTGSALGGLESRLRRHLEGPRNGRPHWHVDYLSTRAVEKSFAVVLTRQRAECDLNRAVAAMPGASVAAYGFGSSDCRCVSHLFKLVEPRWPDYPGLEIWP
ncbi:MAG: GIY-YIG nuclease family protein [Armatimonadetes bacterium]|nr:GIY-YIG nuclease family protein [Armatimonadota bacterium]